MAIVVFGSIVASCTVIAAVDMCVERWERKERKRERDRQRRLRHRQAQRGESV